MRIERETVPAFRPVSILLETPAELQALKSALEDAPEWSDSPVRTAAMEMYQQIRGL